MARRQSGMARGKPVADFPLEFEWQTNDWLKIFDEHVDLIKSDIYRAKMEDRVIVYLSCPISSRGGGYHGTNVEIAKHTERRLLADWGHRFWILNPAQYQMESKEGSGLIQRHARMLNISRDRLDALGRPTGGDYMRMWTRVLVENSLTSKKEEDLPNRGLNFDAFYFLGPTDVRQFFSTGGAASVTAGIEDYFSRKFTMDPDFKDCYSVQGIRWDAKWELHAPSGQKKHTQKELRDEWEERRKDFFRFYAVRTSVNFSLGSHDEWNIFRLINEARLRASTNATTRSGDPGRLLAGFFDGRQIPPGAAVSAVSAGHAIP
jgi:hypothetical protein